MKVYQRFLSSFVLKQKKQKVKPGNREFQA